MEHKFNSAAVLLFTVEDGAYCWEFLTRYNGDGASGILKAFCYLHGVCWLGTTKESHHNLWTLHRALSRLPVQNQHTRDSLSIVQGISSSSWKVHCPTSGPVYTQVRHCGVFREINLNLSIDYCLPLQPSINKSQTLRRTERDLLWLVKGPFNALPVRNQYLPDCG